MESLHIDHLAVLIAALVNLVIGFVWYSRYLFGKKKESGGRLSLLWNGLVAILSAYILAFFEVSFSVTTVSDGMFVGFLVWIGFVATTQIYAVIWSKMSFKHFLVHTGCQLLAYLAMGGIIGA